MLKLYADTQTDKKTDKQTGTQTDKGENLRPPIYRCGSIKDDHFLTDTSN